MENHKPETISRGCAALVNLLLSAIGLLILAVILLPGWVEFPDWVKNLKNVSLIEKRQVWGSPLTFTGSEREKSDNLLIFNTQFRGVPLSEILEKKTLTNNFKVFLTYKKNSEPNELWEMPLEYTRVNQINQIKTSFDYRTLYVMDGQYVRSINRQDGKLNWKTQLSDWIHPDCTECLQLTLTNLLIVLSQDQILYAIDTKTGQIRWQTRLNSPNSQGRGFLANQVQVTLLDQINAATDAPTALFKFNLSDGKVNQKIILNGIDFRQPIFLSIERILAFTEGANRQASLKNFSVTTGQLLWQTVLPENWRIPSQEDTKYENEHEWLMSDLNSVFLNLNLPNTSQQLLKINLKDGKSTLMLKEETYEFRLINQNHNILIINTLRLRGSAKSEIWCVDKISRKILAKYTLKTNQLNTSEASDWQWSADIRQNKLIILEFLETSGNLLYTMVDLTDGQVFSERNFNISPDEWSGIIWTSHEVFMSIRNVYKLDLTNHTLNTEYP